ncbi:GGDEF domain-containing protein [Shewanella sp. 10N.286.51.B7]|uniref:tetratricopeptide repeat-containing diguanylate cyclase n=1 Tax=Shewanella sp. 10N.286.51.B7 TaxID=1880836 RepID=UPI0010556FA2|nr:GGDEF domain-containing protein [Shewanella sp. 10N.286.51.B7]
MLIHSSMNKLNASNKPIVILIMLLCIMSFSFPILANEANNPDASPVSKKEKSKPKPTEQSTTDINQLKLTLSSIELADEKLAFLMEKKSETAYWDVHQQAEFYVLLAIEQEAVDQLDNAYDSYSHIVSMLEREPISDLLVIAYIERSFIKYLQTNVKADYCPDREHALGLARQLNSPDTLVKALTQSAFCYADVDIFEEGLSRLDEALMLAKKHQFTANRQAMIYNSTGAIYRANGLHKYAYEYFREAYNLWRSVDDHQDVFNMLHNMVGESIKVSDWEQAEIAVAGLFDLARQHPEFDDFMFFAHHNAGRSYFFKQDFQRAVEHLHSALQLKAQTNETFFIDITIGYLSLSYMQQNEVDKAFEMASQFIHSNSYQSSPKFLQTSVLALDKFAQKDYQNSFNILLTSLGNERKTYASIMDKDVIYSSLEHSAKVAEYEVKILENQLSINLLKLKSEIDKQQISKLSLTVTALIIAVLLVMMAFLVQSRRFFKRRSQTDYMTGISNRRYTMEQGNKLFALAKKRNEPLAVIIFDIDKFKIINDTYGHAVGDLAIKATASKARHWFKKSDILGRIGGEEFLLILPNTDLDQAVEVAERLRISIEQHQFKFNDITLEFTISLGVSIKHDDSDNLAQMIKAADAGLYKAKNSGRNQVFSA